MASIFKRTKRKNEPYTIQYFDHRGKRRTKLGFTDKGLTEELAGKLELEARMRSSGLIDPMLDRIAEQKRLPIDDHLDAFKESMADNTGKHVKLTMTRVRRIVAGLRDWQSRSDSHGELEGRWSHLDQTSQSDTQAQADGMVALRSITAARHQPS